MGYLMLIWFQDWLIDRLIGLTVFLNLLWLYEIWELQRIPEFSISEGSIVMAPLQNNKHSFCSCFWIPTLKMEVTSFTVNRVRYTSMYMHRFFPWKNLLFFSAEITATLRVHFRNSFRRHIHLEVLLYRACSHLRFLWDYNKPQYQLNLGACHN